MGIVSYYAEYYVGYYITKTIFCENNIPEQYGIGSKFLVHLALNITLQYETTNNMPQNPAGDYIQNNIPFGFLLGIMFGTISLKYKKQCQCRMLQIFLRDNVESNVMYLSSNVELTCGRSVVGVCWFFGIKYL